MTGRMGAAAIVTELPGAVTFGVGGADAFFFAAFCRVKTAVSFGVPVAPTKLNV